MRLGWLLLVCSLFGCDPICHSQPRPNFTPVTDEAFYFSPYNTYSDGPGPFLASNIRAKSQYALWVNPGSYFKTMFTGTSAILSIEVTGAASDQPPKVAWTIDDGPFHTAEVHPGGNELPIAKDLEPKTHSVLFLFSASDANVNRWFLPVEGLKIYGMILDPEGRLLSPAGSVSVSPKKIVFFGDSITEGAWVLGNSNRKIDGRYVDWVKFSDARLSWTRPLALALNAEYGTCGFGGTGWVHTATPFVPALPESWPFYFDKHTRLTDGQLVPTPDYVIVNMGTNDHAPQISATVISVVRQIRKAAGPKAAIILIVPFGQMNRDPIVDAASKVEDQHLFTIDLGPEWAYGISDYGHSSSRSFDGLHPSATATAEFATAMATAIMQATVH
jgi:lysophospholipase L1-like esterase